MKKKDNIILLTFLIVNLACNFQQIDKKKAPVEFFNCKEGQMKRAWYTMGQDESFRFLKGNYSNLIILVDTNLKANNFVSYHEDYARRNSKNIDTLDFSWKDDWKNLSIKQKLKKLDQEKINYKVDADSIHLKNNRGQQQIWIINNSNDTISIQMQDWSFICILQAKSKNNNWLPIEFWKFSTCGNSYYYKQFPPRTANSFITKIPIHGDYKTRLRYKLLGKNKFYYSNEFDGAINYCQFVADSANYIFSKEGPEQIGKFKTPYRLDSLIKLVF